MDVSFSPDGTLLGAVSKDGKARIIDPRANKVMSEWEIPESVRDTQV